MINKDLAGKPKFAHIASKYEAASISADAAPGTERMKNDPAPLHESMHKINEVAKTMADVVKVSSDKSIIGRRKHPAYKGERIPRTYKIPVELDNKMNMIYHQEGIEKQAQIVKAMERWIQEEYPEIA